MEQMNLTIPVDIKLLKPSDGKSADLKFIGIGFDGSTYAIKRKEEHPLLPLTEWVCYHLCRDIGIKTPAFAIVRLLDDSLAFGSKWGEYKELTPKMICADEYETYFNTNDLRSKTESIYTTDFFLPNEDRHFLNLMWEESNQNGKNQLDPIAFDFSRAWIIKQLPFGAYPFHVACNTNCNWNILKDKFNYAISTQTLESIKSLPDKWLENIISYTPKEWIYDSIDETIKFWKNNRTQQCNEVMRQMLTI